jgi:type IV pilus assembly protein PilM
MLTFTRNRLAPLGLSIDRTSASLVQLTGSKEAVDLRTAVQCPLPDLSSAAPEAADGVIANALRTFVNDHRLRGRSVVSCLSADELLIETIRLPQLPKEETANAILQEASERLSLPADEIEVRHLFAGEIRQESAAKREVIMFACPRQLIHRRLKVLENAGLIPVGIDVEPCAFLRSLLRTHRTSDTVRTAYLYCGENASTVMFAEGRRILFLKSIAMGGQHFDNAVSQTLGIDRTIGSQMRSEVFGARQLDGENEVHRSIIDSLRPCFEAIIDEIELCLRYLKVTFRGRVLDGLVMSGSESATWLAEYFGERVGLTCRNVSPLDGVTGMASSESIQQRSGRWATPFGLALKRLN